MESKNDVTNEVVGAGYTAGGATLTGVSFTNTLNVCTFAATIPSWTSSTITARYCVIYDDSGAGASDKALIGIIDFGRNEVTSGGLGTFVVSFSATITAEDFVGFPA